MIVKELTLNDYEKAVEFVCRYERNCLTLVDILLNAKSCEHFYFLLNDNNNISGFFHFVPGGTFVYCFPFLDELEKSISVLAKFFWCKRVFCLNGEGDSSPFLLKTIERAGLGKPFQINNYYLMIKGKGIKNRLSEYTRIKKCNAEDIKMVLPLEVQYQLEEVIPKGQRFDMELCKKSLFMRLGKRLTIGVLSPESDNQLVAKANINAEGKNFCQIGGVYTENAFRHNGFAYCAISNLVNYIEQMGKIPVLFVKQNNIPAIKLYQKAGFNIISDYKICYFRESD